MYIDMLDFCIIFACGFLFALLSYGIYKYIHYFIFECFNKDGLEFIGFLTCVLMSGFGFYGILIMLGLHMLMMLGFSIYIFADEFLEKRYKNKCTNAI